MFPFKVGALVYSRPVTVAVNEPPGYAALMRAFGRNVTLSDRWCKSASGAVVYTDRAAAMKDTCESASASRFVDLVLSCLGHCVIDFPVEICFSAAARLVLDRPGITIEGLKLRCVPDRDGSDAISPLFTIRAANITILGASMQGCPAGLFLLDVPRAGLRIERSVLSNSQVATVRGAPFSLLEFVNTTMRNNTAYAGAVVLLEDSGSVSVEAVDSDFFGNSATVGAVMYAYSGSMSRGLSVRFVRGSVVGSHSTDLGGAFLFSGGLYNSTVEFIGTRFEGNHADTGGVLYLEGVDLSLLKQSSLALLPHAQRANLVRFVNCTLRGNSAAAGGGAVYILHNGNNVLRAEGVVAEGNAAPDGGVYYIAGLRAALPGSPTIVILSGGAAARNVAASSGGVVYATGATVELTGGFLAEGNRAGSRGGVVAFPEIGGSPGRVDVASAYFSSNTAGEFGGAMYVVGEVNVTMTRGRAVGNSAGIDGGALYVGAGCISYGAYNYTTNHAGRSGGAVYVASDARLVGSLWAEGNVALEDGGAVYVRGHAELVAGAISGGRAGRSGGGVSVAGTLSLRGVQLRGNMAGQAGGGLAVTGQAVVSNGSTFTHNGLLLADSGAGGAISAAGAGRGLDLASDTAFVGNTAVLGSDLVLDYPNQTAFPNAGTPPARIRLHVYGRAVPGYPPPAVGVFVLDGYGRELLVPADRTLTLLFGGYSTTISMRAAMNLTAPPRLFFSGSSVELTAAPDPDLHSTGYYADLTEAFTARVTFPIDPCPAGEVHIVDRCVPSQSLVPAGHYYYANNSSSRLCPPGSMRPADRSALQCYPCEPGSVSTPDRVQCNRCESVRSLSWDVRAEACEACPAGALCLGGGMVVPRDGYFHPGLFLLDFPECLSSGACEYAGRSRALEVSRNQSVVEQYLDRQCAPGYEGPLCGSCASGYRRRTAIDCGKCASTWVVVVTFLATTTCLVAFLAYTTSRVPGPGTSVGMAVKITVQYVQQLAILGTYRAGWPETAQDMFSIMGGTVGTGGGVGSSSISCLYTGLSPFVIEAAVTAAATPALLLLTVRVVTWTTAPPIRVYIVVLFFLYPSVVLAAAKLLVCVEVDGSARMLVDTGVECGGGGIQSIAMYAIALPVICIYVLGLPIVLSVSIWRNPTEYTFVHAGLRLRWWWVVSTGRTSVLALIGLVIRGPGAQNLTAQAWLYFYLGVMIAMRPYASRSILIMDVFCVSVVLMLLYLNMWMILGVAATSWQSVAAGIMGLVCVVCLGLRAYVAERLNDERVSASQVVNTIGCDVVKKCIGL
jgi:predicted outer membrane repeat protein